MALNYLQELANALGPRVEEQRQNNTFLGLANTMSQAIPYQQGTKVNPWEMALAESLKGFIGGASEAYGRKQVRDDMRDFSQQWANAAGAKDPVAAFAANPELAEYAPNIQLKTQALEQERQRAKDERIDAMIDKTMLNPGTEKVGNMEREFRIVRGPDGQPQKVYGNEYPRWNPKGGTSVTIQNGQANSTMLNSIYEDQKAAVAGVDLAKGVLNSLDRFDAKEDLVGAMQRGIEANLFKDSEAADLRRRIQEAAIVSLKPNFPGALSDDERRVMNQIAGGDFGVPIGALRRIWQRAANNAAKSGNRGLNVLNSAQLQAPFKPIAIPFPELGAAQPAQQAQQRIQQAGPSGPDIKEDAQGRRWEVVRDANGHVIGRSPVE